MDKNMSLESDPRYERGEHGIAKRRGRVEGVGAILTIVAVAGLIVAAIVYFMQPLT